MEDLKMFICQDCSCEIEIESIDVASEVEDMMIRESLCEDCFNERFGVCELCGKWERREDLTSVIVPNDDIIEVCEHCLNNNQDVFYCDYHEVWEYDNYEYPVEIQNYGTVCQYACENSSMFSYCDECECYFTEEDTHWDEDDERCYCDSCYDEVCGNRVICSYHNHKDDYEYEKLMTREERKEISEGKKICFYGMEIEVEGVEHCNGGFCFRDKQEVAGRLSNLNSSFVYENDGSLNYGFEIISYPFTKKYMDYDLNNQIKEMFNSLKEDGFGVKATCGLHFHITKLSMQQVDNIIYLSEYYKEELTELSKRREQNLNRWAKFYSRGIEKDRLSKSLIDECVRKERYSAINTCNKKTVEFRFFSGTVDYLELMARYEMVYNINVK